MGLEAVKSIYENKSLKKKIVAGAGLAGGDWVLSRGIDGLSIAGAASGVMEPLVRNHPMWVLGVMASVFTVAAGVNAAQNMRLLKDKDIGVSTNPIATVAFHAVDKKMPSKGRLRDGLLGVGQMVSKEHFLIGPALTNEMVLAGLVANTVLKTAFNLAKAAGSEVVLRTKKREKRIKESRHKDLRNSVVIFPAPSVEAGD